MLNVLCIGDPHFKSDNGEETHAMTEKVQALVKARRPDIVVILGDILHRHEKIDLHPFHRAITFLEIVHLELMRYGGFLYIVIGNHDRSNNTIFMTDEHVFNPLKKWENTFVADKAIYHKDIGAVSESPFGCVIIPYVPPGRLIEAIASIDPDFIVLNSKDSINDKDPSARPDDRDHNSDSDRSDSVEINLDEIDYSRKFKESVNIVFTHQEFMGAKMNTITSNVGDPWPKTNPLCMSGHIHDYQVLGENLIYTGTPIQHGFADSTRKTVSWITMNTLTGKFEEERISLGIKGRRQFSIKATEFTDHYKHFLTEAADCYLKLKISGTKTLLKTLTKTSEYKRVNTHPSVKIQLLETVDHEAPIKKTLSSEAKTQIPFRERLEEALKDSKEIRDTFREIFKT